MKIHTLKVLDSKQDLPKQEQLAWKLAELALDEAKISKQVEDMIINRIIDNASVATASLARPAVAHARDQALCHPTKNGATVFGIDNKYRFSSEWAAWANGTAVRELDFHDTYLAADYSHPADNIPPILAVAGQTKKTGQDLLKALVVSYEIHINLVKAICLHKHKIDHIAHLCPAQTAGLGCLLNMTTDRIYQAIQQALHVSFTTRQSRKGEISSWKAYAPAFSGKMAIEAIDRSLRGENSPSPIYEGEDSVVAWMLDGPKAHYKIPLPEKGMEKSAILESYTKAHSAEYQSQALIDLAFEIKKEIKNCNDIAEITIHTSHHTHYVIGTGAGDPQKMDPQASRETLDHSIMYIFAVALEDGSWHHIDSYTKQRATKKSTVNLWQKIKTKEEQIWTKKYHDPDPTKRSFGGRVTIKMKDGSIIEKEKSVANAHPNGSNPYARADYIQKFKTLSEGLIPEQEQNRFLDLAQNLNQLNPTQVAELNIQAGISITPTSKGLFDYS